MEKHFLIGNISKILNIPKSTLRYYDEIKILMPEIRGENGYRYYSREQLILLKKIKVMREMGVSLNEIKKILKNSSIDNMLEIMNNLLIRIREEMNLLQVVECNILNDIKIYHQSNQLQLNTPFFEKVLIEEKGTKVFDFKNLIPFEKLAEKNNKILNKILKISDEEPEKNRIVYAIAEEEKLNNEIIIKKGKYISCYGKNLAKEKKIIDILKIYIENNHLKRKDNNVYLSFQSSTICWQKEDILFKIRILLEE